MKHTTGQVNYRRGYPLRQCGVCSMFRKDGGGIYGTCTDVKGHITPYGLCDIFHGLDNPYGNRMTYAHWKAMHDIYDDAHGYSEPGARITARRPWQR